MSPIHPRESGASIRWFGALAFVSTLALPLPGDISDRIQSLRRIAPDIDPQFAHHLVVDDHETFLRYCRKTGISGPKDALGAIASELRSESAESYHRNFQQALPHLRRICSALASEFGCLEFSRDLASREQMGRDGVFLKRALNELKTLHEDGAMRVDDKIWRYRMLIDEFQRLGYERGIMFVEGVLARDVMQQGNRDERHRLLRSALDRARRLGESVMICQYLGEVGYQHRLAGSTDSMFACYLEGIALADRHRIPEQAARIRLFLASHYLSEGRLAVAADLVREAQEVCRRFRGGPHEVRAVLQAMNRFADLGCWQIVRRLSQRLPVLLRALERTQHDFEQRRYSLDRRGWEGQMLAAEGQYEAAAQIFSDLRHEVRIVHGREGYGSLLADRAEALLGAARHREALAAVDEGLSYVDSFHVTYSGGRLALVRERAALALGESNLASTALEDARRRAAEDELVPASRAFGHDALEARIAAGRGDAAQAHRILRRSYQRLRDYSSSLEPGPQSYLSLHEVAELREVAHELLVTQPEGAYRFELDWRSLPGRFGRSPEVESHRLDRSSSTRDPGNRPFIHLVYGSIGKRLVRWTSNAGEVRREVLAVDSEETDRLVDRTMELVAADPGAIDAPMPEELRALCVRLGELLLPPEVRDGSTSRVLVSAEGSLARLPFEALDAGAGGEYEPLLARHDVAYARTVPARPGKTRDGSTVVLVGVENRRSPARPSGTLAPLVAVESEASRAIARLPGGRILKSTEVSKQALLSSWSRASILYVAAHLVRDPEAPLLCYFPITFGARRHRLDDTYLDLRDVRSTDLAGCELVVLSSCASGEPYVVGGRSGPSMADALLDAGAESVIHTRWRVRDERAAVVAPGLAEVWSQGKGDPWTRWSAARRAVARGLDGYFHPFDWAAWSVTIALPTTPWQGDAGTPVVSDERSERSASARPEGTAALGK